MARTEAVLEAADRRVGGNGRGEEEGLASSLSLSASASLPESSASLRALSPSALQTLSSLADVILSREAFAADYDLTFDGRRNLSKALGYKSSLSIRDFRRRYERSGIAKRIVDYYPESVWIDGAAIFDNPDADTETEFERQVIELFGRLQVWSKILRADKLAGLGRYAILLIGAGDTINGNLEAELTKVNGPDSILYIKPYAEDKAKIEKLVENASDPRYGQVLYYSIRTSPSKVQKVHASRVIHIAKGTLEDDIYGEPDLRSVWDYLDDLMKIVGGGAEASWKRMDPGLHMDMDPNVKFKQESLEDLQEKADEFVNNLTRIIKTRGVKINQLSTDVYSFGANADTILTLIAGSKSIPKRVLLGSERGELASSQDRAERNDRVTIYRKLLAEPLVRELVDKLILISALPVPLQGKYLVEWPEEEELSESEKASVASTLATANKNQVDAGGGLIATGNEIRDRVLGMEPLEENENDEDMEDEDLEEDLEDGEDEENNKDDEG